MNKKNSILKGNAVYVFLSIIIGFAVGAVLLLAAGISPGEIGRASCRERV